MKFIIANRSTHQYINQQEIPANMVSEWVVSIVQSLDPTLEILVWREPYAKPTVDERVVNVIITEAYVDVVDTEYPQFKQWQRTYLTEQKTNVEIALVLEDLEGSANESVIPYQKQLKYCVAVIELLYVQLIDLKALKAKEQKIVTKFRKQAKKVLNNHDIKKTKLSILTAGTLPPLDTDWSLDDFGSEE